MAYAKDLDLIGLHYNSRLLDEAIHALAPVLSANAQVMASIQNVQDAIHTANAHVENWRRTGWPDRTSVLRMASDDARGVMNSSQFALDGIKRMFETAQ